jgi:mono/diheme cytochrome c family protein
MLASTLGVLLALPAVAETAARAVPEGAQEPMAGPLNRIGEGRRLFLKMNCYGCHGIGATGGMGPNIVGRDVATVRDAVMEGRAGGMRSFRDYLTEKDVRRIAAYLNSIGTEDEPFFTHWWKANPPK